MSVPLRVPCAGAVVTDGTGALLLVRRRHAPQAGSWSIPGGRVETGETAAAAAVREVAEETGLEVHVVGLLGTVEITVGDAVLVVDDFRCRLRGGTLRAGDDAAAAAWVPGRTLGCLALVDGLVEALRGWGVELG